MVITLDLLHIIIINYNFIDELIEFLAVVAICHNSRLDVNGYLFYFYNVLRLEKIK